MEQLVLAASVAPQVWLAKVKALALAPPMAIDEMCRVAAPLLVRFTFQGELVECTVWLPKVRLDGVISAEGLAALALPVSGIERGLPEPLSVTTRLAVKLPAEGAVNLISIVQLELAASVAPQVVVLLNAEALAPVMAMLEIVMGPLLELVYETTCPLVATPMVALGKLSEEGARLATSAVPVPVRGIDCGLPDALSVTLRVAE